MTTAACYGYLRLHVHFAGTSESSRQTTFPTAKAGKEVAVEATSHPGGVFESNQTSFVYRNRLAGIQVFENNGSTGIQKSNAVVPPSQLLSAIAQTCTTASSRAAIIVASDIHITQFGHVGSRLCDHTTARAHVGTKFDGDNLWILERIERSKRQ